VRFAYRALARVIQPVRERSCAAILAKPQMPNKSAVVRLASFALSAALVWLVPPVAHAGTITGVGAVLGTGLGTVNVPPFFTLSEGNDDQPGGPGIDANIIVPIKRFDNAGFIDIEFFVRSSEPSGTTEYQFFESVDNNTFINWDMYTLQLGFGLGAGFVPGPADDGLDFDFDTLITPPTSTAFPIVAWSQDELVFSGGLHSTGSQVYQIRIDVPDGIETFTLRQFPRAVPEPTTIALATVGCLGLATWSLRRRRSRIARAVK
jgi:hypothetical protein